MHVPSDLARTIMAALATPGAFQSLTWQTSPKPAAAHKGRVLIKQTTMVCRTGVEYPNIASVAMRLAEEGRSADDLTLPWGEWAMYPYLIVHKGCEYLRVSPAVGARPRSTYTVDGAEVDAETFYGFLPPSARPKPGEPGPEVLTIKVGNLIA
jgi:hypothetical protein